MLGLTMTRASTSDRGFFREADPHFVQVGVAEMLNLVQLARNRTCKS